MGKVFSLNRKFPTHSQGTPLSLEQAIINSINEKYPRINATAKTQLVELIALHTRDFLSQRFGAAMLSKLSVEELWDQIFPKAEDGEKDCSHDEHDHGICLDCGEDMTNDLVAAAESAFEGDR